MRAKSAFAILVLAAILAAGPVRALSGAADSFRKIGAFNAWEAYSFKENEQIVCYIVSQPTKKRGDYKRRGDVFAMVTHRPGEKSRDVVSFYAGYTLEKGSSVDVRIGSGRFDMFTAADAAWARTKNADAALVRAMIRGAGMVVKGTSRFGTLTTDTYSLRGFTAAYRAISRACKTPALS